MATLKEIAAKAGVSVGTVSKVLNNRMGDQQFGADCVAKIKQTAADLGYIPNYHARSLKSGTSYTVGMLLGVGSDVLWNDYWARLVGGMMSAARKQNYHLININGSDGQSPMETALRFIKEQRIDALVIPYYASFDLDLHKFQQDNFPVVLALNPNESQIPSVTVDDAGGVSALVAHLAGLGHDEVLWLGPQPKHNPSSQSRLKGFRSACKKLGIKGHEILSQQYPKADQKDSRQNSINATLMAIDKNLETFNESRAVVCYNDATLYAFYQTCQRMGISIPHDKSVCVFDDAQAAYMLPACTSASHMLSEIGQRVMEIAIDMHQNKKKYDNYRELIPSTVVVRESTTARVDKGV